MTINQQLLCSCTVLKMKRLTAILRYANDCLADSFLLLGTRYCFLIEQKQPLKPRSNFLNVITFFLLRFALFEPLTLSNLVFVHWSRYQSFKQLVSQREKSSEQVLFLRFLTLCSFSQATESNCTLTVLIFCSFNRCLYSCCLLVAVLS